MISRMHELELQVEKMAFEGRAIARWGRFVIFVEGALPGERVLARITKRKRRHAYAELAKVLAPSPHRVKPPCPMFSQCGGCMFQNMEYAAQIEMKQQVLIESLHGVPFPHEALQPILPCEPVFHFRNKMVFAFGMENGQPVTGLHARGDWQRVVSASTCLLQSPEAAAIVADAAAFVRERAIPVWDDLSQTGLLRHLVIREGKHTRERMIHLHAAEWHASLESLAERLAPHGTTLLVSAHRNVPEAAPDEATRVVKGDGIIHERLNHLLFEVGPTTFFQTNTLQAERMFAMLQAWAQETGAQCAVDLYSGTGPIAAHLSSVAARVLAVESNAASVDTARRNFAANGITNVEILCGEVERHGPGLFPKDCDLIVVDPPRPGLHRKAVDMLLASQVKNLFYVSCNPATLARDLKWLTGGGYRITRIQPIDLFPHTFHIETAVALQRA